MTLRRIANFLGLLGLVVGESQAGEFAFYDPVRPPRPTQVMARGGAKDQVLPDTTLSIEHSFYDAVEWVEVEVRRTRDGRHVLFQDRREDSAAGAAARVEERSLAELRAVDVGAAFATRFTNTRIATLEEALASARGRINLCLTCRGIDPASLTREILDAGMERQVVLRGDPKVLRDIRAASKGERLGLMLIHRAASTFDADLDELRPAAVEVDAADATSSRCRSWHDRGIKIEASTLGRDDRPEVWDRVTGAGADWVRTDRAEEFLAHEVLRRAGSNRVRISLHRAASWYAPENTLPALEKAIRLGADFVEFDVRTARDGNLFLMHDGTVNRTTNGRGPIRALDAAAIRGLDAGKWFGKPFAGVRIPTLDEFLRAADHRVELYFDAKDVAPEALVKALRTHGLIDHAVVYQESDEYLVRLRALEPRVRRMPTLRDPTRLDALADRVAPAAFDVKWSILSKRLIDQCHARNIRVFSDALGFHESIRQYQWAIKAGVDLIQTDHPLRVLRAIELLDAERIKTPTAK